MTEKRLLDQVRDAIRWKHTSLCTERSYLNWIRRYILFHNKRHPAEMGKSLLQRENVEKVQNLSDR